MANESDLLDSFIPTLHKPSALLPIARHRSSLLYLIENFPVTIVVGQTGSGKTTQIPQFLEQAGWCEEGSVIAVTQVGELRNCFNNFDSVLKKHLIEWVLASKSCCYYGSGESSGGNGMQAW